MPERKGWQFSQKKKEDATAVEIPKRPSWGGSSGAPLEDRTMIRPPARPTWEDAGPPQPHEEHTTMIHIPNQPTWQGGLKTPDEHSLPIHVSPPSSWETRPKQGVPKSSLIEPKSVEPTWQSPTDTRPHEDHKIPPRGKSVEPTWQQSPELRIHEDHKAPVIIPDYVAHESLQVTHIGPITKFLGVNTQDPLNLPLGSATSLKNLSAAGGVFPSLTTRPNFTALGTSFAANVTGMALYLNSELNAVAGGVWRKWNGTTWTNVLTALSTTAKWSFTNFKGNLAKINLIGVNGVDPAKKYDGTTATNLAGVPAGVNFKMIDEHDNRLYASDGKAVYFSALNKPEDWTTANDAGNIQIETNTGEDVTAIVAGMKHLMVFKPNSFAELWGTGPHNYQLQQVSETGAVGLNAVTIYDQTAYWIHSSGVYRYTGGLPRKDFSLPVIDYFKQMNKAAVANASAVSTRNSVLFSIPTGVSTTNDTTLEFLPDYGIWCVWQDFAPNQWLYMGDNLTYGDATSIFQQQANSTGVQWEWISQPFGSGSSTAKKHWYQLAYVMDVPAGSGGSFTISVSKKAEGNAPGDWIDTGFGGGAVSPYIDHRVYLPLKSLANANWMRIKLVGTGTVKFHEISIQQRTIPVF